MSWGCNGGGISPRAATVVASRLGNRATRHRVPGLVEVEYLDIEIIFTGDATMLGDLGLLLLGLQRWWHLASGCNGGGISPREPSNTSSCSRIGRSRVSRYRDNFHRRCHNARGSGITAAAADAGDGVPGARGAEGVRVVRRAWVRGRRGLHREPGVPTRARMGGAGGGGGARRRGTVRARSAHTARRTAGARHDGGRDRQGARAEGLLRAERWLRVQPGADHRGGGAGRRRTGSVLAGPSAGARALSRAIP